MNLDNLQSVFTANNVKTLEAMELWQPGTEITTLVLDGDAVRLTTSGIKPQLLVKTTQALNVIEIDKGSLSFAASGHVQWTIKQCVAARDFSGVALTSGKLVSREEFTKMLASGDSAAVVDTTRSDKGVVNIVKGATKLMAYAS